MTQVYVADVALDWLSLGSWSLKAYTDAHAILRRELGGTWKPKRWLNYDGFGFDGAYVGRGMQRKQPHYMIRVSGRYADVTYSKLLGIEAYATRLDLQVTIPAPGDHLLPDIHKRTSSKTKTLIDGYENDTLYVGNRASDIFCRLYEKLLDTLYLRLEFELKGDRSRAAWIALADETLTPESIFEYYLSRSPLPDDIKQLYITGATVPASRIMREQMTKDAQNKLAWIRGLDGALIQAMADHEIGEDVKAIVRYWAMRADNLDKS